ncbi:MAG: hypothetical protein HY898_09070 [Deltaproteobacteria bacterium]|nr:hypothetical protein [Deltaproteobacteria bacterium]
MQAAPYAPQTGPVLTYDDESHLRTLSILHYIYGGLLLFAGAFFLIYVVIGVAMIADRHSSPEPNALLAGGILFLAIGALVMLFAAAKGTLTIYAGVCLASRRRPTLCMVAAALSCLNFPLGTALGVFSLIVLSRPTVKAAFAQNR